MPTNEYYDSSGVPSQGSSLSPRLIRAEFDAIEAGFNKMPQLQGHDGELVRINTGGSRLEAVPAANLSGTLGIEMMANRDIHNGHIGKTGSKANLYNDAGTYKSLLEHNSAIGRIWTLPDASGTLLDTADTAAITTVDSPVFTGSPTVPSVTYPWDAGYEVLNTESIKDILDGNASSQYFTGDMCLQFGAVQLPATAGTPLTVNFPHTCSGIPIGGVVVCPISSSTYFTCVYDITTSGFTVKGAIGGLWVGWIALTVVPR